MANQIFLPANLLKILLIFQLQCKNTLQTNDFIDRFFLGAVFRH